MSAPSGRHRRQQENGEHQPVLAPGTEDVLARPEAEPVPAHRGVRHTARPRGGRRSPWNRGRDRVAAALITVLAVTAGVVVWTFSDSRATTQETASPPPPLPAAPESVPAQLTQRWQAPSEATPVPVAEGASVVTASGGAVVGRDPLTGQQRWRYARDLPLCTVGGAWDRVLAVYRKDTGCSEVTQLDPGTGRRTAQRNGDAELGTRLVADSGHVTTTGEHLLNTWRNDLVKSMEYGRVYGQVNPDKQPRTGCTYDSVAAASGRVGVIERCPGENADRLTVLVAAGEEADEPEEEFSSLLPGVDGTLVAMSGESVAVAMHDSRQLVVFDVEGRQRASYPLDVPAADLAPGAPQRVAPTATGGENVYWFTGSRTIALSRDDLAPRWTLKGTLGPGTVFAGQYVVPIPGGLAVVDEATGGTVRTVAVDRRGDEGPVLLAAAGPVLLEQRGGTVAGLR